MKIRVSYLSCIAAAALAVLASALPTAARAADIRVSFTETHTGGTETLSVAGYPGAIIGGTTDDWTIRLPGITLTTLAMAWVEGPGDTGYNDLSRVDNDTLRLVSEAATFPLVFCSTTPAPLPLGVSCLIGNGGGNSYFATVLEKTAAVPEPASLALLGSALLGLGLIRFRRNRV